MTQDTKHTDDLREDQVDNAAEAEAQDTGAEKADKKAPQDTEVEALQNEIERLQDELGRAKEQVLRAHADAQNARRRAEQDVEKAHKFGVEKFVSDILPVADNLERAATAAADQAGDFAAVAEGVQLTLRTLIDALKRHHVEPINPEGEPFDPQLHQAMTAVEQADVEPNTVINVFQPGYTLHGRLVRPAMVVVSKAVAKE